MSIFAHSQYGSRRQYQVRVLLDEFSDSKPRTICSQKGMLIVPSNTSKIGYKYLSNCLDVVYRDGFWHINNKKVLCSQLIIQPIDGHLACNERTYAGFLLLIIDKGKAHIISQLDIEEYVYSVLRSESWPGWPVEVNKAFAIASRSYVVAKILEATKQKKIFHVKNTNIHQTYTGVHTTNSLKRAVQETKGVILAWKGQPIIAMFDSCCGGIIPADIENVVDFEKAPYLARDYSCTFCKKYRIFFWNVEYAFHEVLTILKSSGILINSLCNMQVSKRDKAGVVQEVIIHDGIHSHSIHGKQCYSLLAHVKSFCFSIDIIDKKIVVSGFGYGHHVGLCQWGARAMIDHGWNFKRILQFYYPGTYFVRLKNES